MFLVRVNKMFAQTFNSAMFALNFSKACSCPHVALQPYLGARYANEFTYSNITPIVAAVSDYEAIFQACFKLFN